MTQGIMKELAEIQKKANKYDNIKARYVEHAEQLKKAIKLLQDLAQDIDPMVNLGSVERTGVNYQVLAAEVFEKMLSGLEVSSDLLAKTYPHLSTKNVLYLMKSIKEKYAKKILKRKEGIKVFLYVQKDI